MIVNAKNRNKTIYDRTELLLRYYDDIKKYKILTQEEEIELFKIIKNGSKIQQEKAKAKIIESNQRFVVSVAKNFATNNNLLDLINEGNIGLIEAIDTFSIDKQIRFTSWAVWYIRRAINIYCINNLNIVKKNNLSKTYHVVAQATNFFTQTEHRLPTSEELLNLLKTKYNVDIKDSHDITQTQIIHIDEEFQNDDDDSYNPNINEFNLYSSNMNSYETQINNDFNHNMIKSLLSILSEREQEIIKMIFGIDYDRAYEIQEVAKKMNLTNERVRQLKCSIIEKLQAYIKDKTKKLR